MTPEEVAKQVRDAEEKMYAEERNECAYYTENREGGYELKCKDTEFVAKFIEHCKTSQAAFLNTEHWAEVIGNNDFAPLFDPITRYETVLKGHIGSIAGCKLYTNAFLSRQARTGHTSENVVFVPR